MGVHQMRSLELLGSSALRSGMFLAFAAAFVTTPAHAQDQTGDQPEPVISPVAESEDGESILITGSRIRRAGFDTLEPAVVVSNEYLETRGLTNVADALNEIPSFGVGVS